MKTNTLILVAFVLMSNLTFSQTESTGIWNDIVGFKMFDLLIAAVAIVGLFFLAYLASREKKKH